VQPTNYSFPDILS